MIEKSDLIKYLNEEISKEDLYREWILPMVAYYRLVHRGEIESPKTKEEVFTIISIKSTFTKNQLAHFAADNYDNDDFFRHMVDILDRRLLEQLVWDRKKVKLQDLGRDTDLTSLKIEKVTVGFYQKEELISIDPVIGDRYKEFLRKPTHYHWQDTVKGEIERDIEDRFCNEVKIFEVLPRLIDLARKNLIKTSKTGAINLTYAKRIQKELDIPEFFEGHPNKKFSHINTKWLLMIATYAVQHNWADLPIAEIIDKIIKRISYDTYHIWEHTKDQYTGTSKVLSDPLPTQELLVDILEDFSKHNHWIGVENYMNWTKYHSKWVLPFKTIDGIVKVAVEDHYSNSMHVTKRNCEVTLLEPYMLSFIYLLGTLGIVDVISHEDPTRPVQDYGGNGVLHNPFYGLTAFKITDLGRHLMGELADYEAPEVEYKQTEMDLDETHLTISLTQKDLIVSTALKEFAMEINDQLFVVDKTTFLQKVSDRADLQEKIARFYELLKTKDLPDNWQSFLLNLEGHFNPLIVESTSYISMIIPQDSDQIVSLLRHEKRLQGLYIKGEGRRVLVPANKYDTFKKVMRDLGWVIER